MKKSELKALIFETICEHYQDRYRKALLKEDQDKNQAMVFGKVNEGEELPDSTEQILAKFPTLRHALVRLQTEDFMQFVSGIDWISPKPTEFRINLKNGQNFLMKWMGKDFQATVSGKTYYLGRLTDFQQALNKLSILYQEGPMGTDEEGVEDGGGEGGADSGFDGGGSGDFPGVEGGGDFGGEEAGGAEEGGEEGDKDVKDAEIDFESDDNF